MQSFYTPPAPTARRHRSGCELPINIGAGAVVDPTAIIDWGATVAEGATVPAFGFLARGAHVGATVTADTWFGATIL